MCFPTIYDKRKTFWLDFSAENQQNAINIWTTKYKGQGVGMRENNVPALWPTYWFHWIRFRISGKLAQRQCPLSWRPTPARTWPLPRIYVGMCVCVCRRKSKNIFYAHIKFMAKEKWISPWKWTWPYTDSPRPFQLPFWVSRPPAVPGISQSNICSQSTESSAGSATPVNRKFLIWSRGAGRSCPCIDRSCFVRIPLLWGIRNFPLVDGNQIPQLQSSNTLSFFFTFKWCLLTKGNITVSLVLQKRETWIGNIDHSDASKDFVLDHKCLRVWIFFRA